MKPAFEKVALKLSTGFFNNKCETIMAVSTAMAPAKILDHPYVLADRPQKD